MRPGVLRAVTHLDSDRRRHRACARARARGARGACPRLKRSTGCSPSGRPTGCRSVAAAVVRKGEIVVVERGRHRPTTTTAARRQPDTQYRIGSITKTFTATAIMQLRAAGQARPRRPARAAPRRHRQRLADDPADARAPLGPAARGGRDVRRRASRRPRSELIESMVGDRVRLAPGAAAPLLEPRVRAARPGRRAQAAACRTPTYVDERIIEPLGLARTTWAPQAPKAQGYLVDEYARTVWTEPETDLGGHRGGGAALVDRRGSRPLGGVPRRAAPTACSTPKTVEEMWFPQVMYYPDDWVLGWGLGLMLYNQRRRDLRRPRRRDGRPSRRRLRQPQDADRRRRR